MGVSEGREQNRSFTGQHVSINSKSRGEMFSHGKIEA